MEMSLRNAQLPQRLQSWLPGGRLLPDEVWQRRHRFILWLLAGHAFCLFVFGLTQGFGVGHSFLVGGVVGAAGLGAALPLRRRAYRSSIAGLGLVAASSVLTYLSGGYIEMHFHFFVALALITLYQEWGPFLVASAYTVLHHGVMGTLEPLAVYNHAAGIAHPWRWALVHGVFVAAASIVYVMQWRFNEDLRDHAQTILDSTGEGILGLDQKGRIAFANPAAGKLLGYRPDRLVGRPGGDILPNLAARACARAVGEGRQVEEGTALHADGRHVPVSCVVTPVLQGISVRSFVIALSDLTERREAEAERLRQGELQVERLRSLDRLKTTFLNAAAHELRTPLTPLRIQLHVLQRRANAHAAGQAASVSHKGAAGPEAKDAGRESARALEILDRNFARLQHLIEDILNVARLQAGRIQLKREPVDLTAAISEAVDAFRPLAELDGIKLESECPDGVWVDADALRYSQILFNLVSNGIRYTPKGGTVTLRAGEVDGEVLVSVTDTGVGLTTQQVGRLFQPFEQVHEDLAAQRAGTGLGLFIAKSLVDLHGGRIWAQSDGPGEGSTFSFAIPRQDAQVVRMTDRVVVAH